MTDKIQQIDWSQLKVLSFDLDDTLWDNSGVIERCQQQLFKFLQERHPPIKRHFNIDSMERIGEQLQQQQPAEYDNMTLLRKAVIKQMLNETGGDLSLVSSAFAVFYYWRNQIAIPNRSIEVLAHLAKQFSLVATSNGNSNLHLLGLSQYFEKHLIAGIHGQAKPSPEMLNKLVEYYQISPHQLLHIGDNYATDIQSAINAKVQHLEIDYSQIQNLLNV